MRRLSAAQQDGNQSAYDPGAHAYDGVKQPVHSTVRLVDPAVRLG
jgi:hypothetical protein